MRLKTLFLPPVLAALLIAYPTHHWIYKARAYSLTPLLGMLLVIAWFYGAMLWNMIAGWICWERRIPISKSSKAIGFFLFTYSALSFVASFAVVVLLQLNHFAAPMQLDGTTWQKIQTLQVISLINGLVASLFFAIKCYLDQNEKLSRRNLHRNLN